MKQLNLYYIGGSDQKPEGRTVVPTDDIQIWLKCAGLNKPYTTLAEVLADSSTLEALIADSNAVDYLVRSTSFAKSEALVPAMTSDTTPEGVCFADSATLSYRPAYLAFDGTQDTYWESHSTTSSYVGYQFTSAKKINGIYWKHYVAPNNNHNLVVQGSNDGTNWTNIKTFTNVLQQEYTATFENENSYSYYRVYFNTPTTTAGGGGLYTSLRTVQFYSKEGLTDNATAMSYIGLNNYASNTLLADSTWCSAICNSTYFESVLNVKTPDMTGATTPSGVAFDNGSYDNNNPAWYSFSSQVNKYWVSPNGSGAGKYFGYEFTSAVKIFKAVISSDASYATGTYAFNSAKIQATNNDWSNPIDLQSYNNSGETDYGFIFNNPTAYSKYRWICTAYSGGKYYGGMKLQFYGRADI